MVVNRLRGNLRSATDELNSMAERLEREQVRILDEMLADEEHVRPWQLTIIDSDRSEHQIALTCSRKVIRQLKRAVFAAGGDALAVEAISD